MPVGILLELSREGGVLELGVAQTAYDLEHLGVRIVPAPQDFLPGEPAGVCRRSRVQRVRVAAPIIRNQKGHFLRRPGPKHSDERWNRAFPVREVADDLLERPSRGQLLVPTPRRQRPDRLPHRAVRLRDLLLELTVRNTPDRGTHQTPPSGQIPVRRRLRLLWRTRGTGA